VSEATFTVYAGGDGCGRAGQPWIRQRRVTYPLGDIVWLTTYAWEEDRNLHIRIIMDLPVMSPELWHGEWLGFYRECWGMP
jgi:hypothetical protein